MGSSCLFSTLASLQNASKGLLKLTPKNLTEQTKGSSDNQAEKSWPQSFKFTSCLKTIPYISKCVPSKQPPECSLVQMSGGSVAMWPQLCTLLGSQGSQGSSVHLQGQGRSLGGFVVGPWFSESYPLQDLSDTVSGAACFLTLRVFLAACNPRNNEILRPLHHPRASAEKQAAIINRWYLQFPLSCLQGFLE